MISFPPPRLVLRVNSELGFSLGFLLTCGFVSFRHPYSREEDDKADGRENYEREDNDDSNVFDILKHCVLLSDGFGWFFAKTTRTRSPLAVRLPTRKGELPVPPRGVPLRQG